MTEQPGGVCSQPDPTNSGAPCGQDAAYLVRLSGFHGVPGEVEVAACADHLAWWREAFPDAVLAARTLTAPARTPSAANGPSRSDDTP